MFLSFPENKRIIIVTGHYGSGKTEFSVSLAMALARNNTTGFKKIALCDLDIINPYFRSRERTDILENLGVKVYGGIFGTGSTAEIPELSAAIRTPLEDKDCFTIIDVGGNDSGARVLTQFGKYFTADEHFIVTVVNASRPDTRDVDGAVHHIGAIEKELGMAIDGIINNTHMLTETTSETVKRGHELCEKLSLRIGKPFLCDCYPEKFVSREDLNDIPGVKMPLGMYMRQSWLDR